MGTIVDTSKKNKRRRMASKSLQAVQQIVKFVTKPPSFDAVLKNIRVISAEEGKCVCELTVTEEHQNRGGTLHGGLSATLVDTVTTCALMTAEGGAPGVSVDLNVSYLNAAKVGEDIVISANTLKVGKTLAFLKADITRKSDGKLVATGSHTKHIG